MTRRVKIGPVSIGGGAPLAMIAGPCVIEDRKKCVGLARRLATLAAREGIPLIFKASYDKANRSSSGSFRGPGLEKGLEILREVKDRFGMPVLTDVHSVPEAEAAGVAVDVLQIPAFLCRQTDLLLAAGRTGRCVNIKKGQFMAPWDMKNAVAKVESTGNRNVLLTERGTTHGYNDLVVDMRGLLLMRESGVPVVFDATHSVQKPGGRGDRSGGESRMAPGLARAAVAAGCDAVFIETYVRPETALSDGDNAMPVAALGRLWRVLRRISDAL
ncbi:MAG: 3-deoxy-8-phosphooctulonate synthase [Lentisphaerae bacterium]|nr:3-deoxy-8-phosphooctulonate synthase [Lentisphaerota bacterium]